MRFFTIEELCKTSQKYKNVPDETQELKLTWLIENVLDPARTELGTPITVNSGFRSAAVNAAVGGSITSQHLLGEAADLDCHDNYKLFEIIKKLPFDQLIWEFGNAQQPQWVHVSYGSRHRRQILRSRKNGHKTIYESLQTDFSTGTVNTFAFGAGGGGGIIV